MSAFSFRIAPESPEHATAIERLNAEAFGPGRFARAAFRLREGVAPRSDLSFLALSEDNEPVGSARMTDILIGGRKCLLLGPLVASPRRRGFGIGRELMSRCLHAARKADERFVILVGDLAYYERFGFRVTPRGWIGLPAPADPNRVLHLELPGGALSDHRGRAAPSLSSDSSLAALAEAPESVYRRGLSEKDSAPSLQGAGGAA